jgi:hypothetical protein
MWSCEQSFSSLTYSALNGPDCRFAAGSVLIIHRAVRDVCEPQAADANLEVAALPNGGMHAPSRPETLTDRSSTLSRLYTSK